MPRMSTLSETCGNTHHTHRGDKQGTALKHRSDWAKSIQLERDRILIAFKLDMFRPILKYGYIVRNPTVPVKLEVRRCNQIDYKS